MKYTALFTTMTALVAAGGRANLKQGGNAMAAGGPANDQASNNPGPSNQAFPSLTASQKAQLQAASIQWADDTSLVSCALKMGGQAAATPGSISDQDLSDLMDAAYVAEVDETIQKATIDALLGDMPIIQSASANLTNGTFTGVVDGLREVAIRGTSNETAVKAIVDQMNTVRCNPVMLAIDAYIQTALKAIGNDTLATAVRPPACIQILNQTGTPITQAVVNNCTQPPKANELVRDYGQSPTFQLSRSVMLSQNRGNAATGRLGDTFPNQSSNQSSLMGEQPGLFPIGFNINGPISNGAANPIDVDLGFASASANTTATTGTTGTNSTTPAGTGAPAAGTGNAGAGNAGAGKGGAGNTGAGKGGNGGNAGGAATGAQSGKPAQSQTGQGQAGQGQAPQGNGNAQQGGNRFSFPFAA